MALLLAGSAGRGPAGQSGQSVTLSFPYVGPREGRFENHWVLCLEGVGQSRAYFGTPLVVETVVR